MRSQRAPDITIPQFRTLTFVNRNADTSLSEVAEHMGLTLPATSKLVDDLTRKNLITRQDQPTDRRKIKLNLTPKGLQIMETCRNAALTHLSTKSCKHQTADSNYVQAMETVHSLFTVNN
jgi:MarR family transcriptional regulator for hemolysin